MGSDVVLWRKWRASCNSNVFPIAGTPWSPTRPGRAMAVTRDFIERR